ncbi:hypothetical protein [Methylobacterium brachythecii]|uniref:Uncharacterized protein n=1 Tax=Methylobacterium brachythecii TaxID=1176177 RepID=A0A7W6ADF1_9HYPH|nr:hypothetical protein [Methylobacterium brachythecii]MBB3900673.1 hypothetical protein [Methylobacterium brachythecii]GLS43550.1 hypothetical protein GCM10007884_15350 [Methylobacterium brachythecii]
MRTAPILAALLSASTAHVGEGARPSRLDLDHGIAATLPADWQADDEASAPVAYDTKGYRRLQIVCHSESCRRSQESCTFVLKNDRVEGDDDASRLSGLYATALSRYARLRAAVKNTGEQATLRRSLERETIGPREWWVLETQARPGFKSALFAETVIDGWYVGAICRTCETGEIRHGAARAMLSSVDRRDSDGF